MPYYFGDCMFDPTGAELRRTGKPVHVRPIAFRLLHYLIEQHDRAVSKQELFDHVWPNRIISDATLSTTIKEIRQAIGDKGYSASMIQTLHGHGYRFIAPVTNTQEASSGSAKAPTTIPFVGRQIEQQLLLTAWHQAEQGHPHLVVIGGEAGIGKTRLAKQLRTQLAAKGISSASAGAYAIETKSAYGPVSEWLHAAPIQSALADLAPIWLSDIARLLPQLLAERLDLAAPQPLCEAWQRQRFFEALARAILAPEQPLLLLIDDLQWCDQDTLDWLHYLLHFDSQAKLLIVTTLRREELANNPALATLLAQLHKQELLSEIELRPLDAQDTVLLATHILEQTPTVEQLERLYRITSGHPLFIVELSRAQLGPDIPPKLQAIIAARLAQLSNQAQELTQLAAASGRRFTLDFLSCASGKSEEIIVSIMDELWCERIIHESEGYYDFSHDLVRTVAYNAVSPIKRQLLHRHIADALEKQQPNCNATRLATHNAHAGRWEKATLYYAQAATDARALSARAEETAALEHALAALDKLPASATKQRRQIDFYLDLGLARSASTTWGSPAVGATWQQGYDLAMQTGTMFQQGRALNALDTYYRDNGQWQQSEQLAETALALAATIDDPYLKLCLVSSHGALLLHLGEPAQALQQYENVLAWADTEIAPSFNWFNRTHITGAYFRSAQCLWLLGYPDQAYERAHQARRLAQRSSDPFHQAITLFHIAMVYEFAHDVEQLEALGGELVGLATKYGFPFYVRAGKMYQGWALAHCGQAQQGAAIVKKIADGNRQQGTRMFEPYWLANVAETLLLADDTAMALQEIDAALDFAIQTHNCYWNAQLLKLKGDCLCRQDNVSEAENFYQLAIDTAQQQQAQSLQLRATLGLCLLWQQQGKHKQAYECLTNSYARFTEGFASYDLQNAEALLDSLLLSKQKVKVLMNS